GGIVNIESLIEPSREIRDRGELDAELVRDHRFWLAKSELNADFCLRWRGAAFAQHAGGIGERVFAQFDRHPSKTALGIRGDMFGHCAPWHEPFRFQSENAKAGR